MDANYFMSAQLHLVSPIDGLVYVERHCADDARIERALTAAAQAQRAWKQRPLAERAAFCTAAVDAMLTMREQIVPELAWQMGRPVRYGAGVF